MGNSRNVYAVIVGTVPHATDIGKSWFCHNPGSHPSSCIATMNLAANYVSGELGIYIIKDQWGIKKGHQRVDIRGEECSFSSGVKRKMHRGRGERRYGVLERVEFPAQDFFACLLDGYLPQGRQASGARWGTIEVSLVPVGSSQTPSQISPISGQGDGGPRLSFSLLVSPLLGVLCGPCLGGGERIMVLTCASRPMNNGSSPLYFPPHAIIS